MGKIDGLWSWAWAKAKKAGILPVPANMGPAVPDLTAAYFQSVFKIFTAMLPELLVETIAYLNTAVKCDIVSVR